MNREPQPLPLPCYAAIRQNAEYAAHASFRLGLLPQTAAPGDHLEVAAYRRLLLRLLALPIVALGLLALTLAYGIQQMQRSERRVDHSDRVIAHANQVVKLMVDEETGIRGFLITRDPIFLQPYREANQHLEPEFTALFGLISRDPEQTARLQRLKAGFQEWQQDAATVIAPPQPAWDSNLHMLERKRKMDDLRAIADDFLGAEMRIRASRSFTALRVDKLGLYGLLGLAAILALLLAWEIRRLFKKLASTYNMQINEVKRWGDECYSHEQWLNTTLRSIGDAVIAADPDGNVVFMNPVAEELTGWREKEADGLPLSSIFVIVNQRTRVSVESPVDAVRRSGKIAGLANHTILISKDLKEFHIDDSAAPILDVNARMIGIVLVFRDITQRHASEAALMRAEKLASADGWPRLSPMRSTIPWKAWSTSSTWPGVRRISKRFESISRKLIGSCRESRTSPANPWAFIARPRWPVTFVPTSWFEKFSISTPPAPPPHASVCM